MIWQRKTKGEPAIFESELKNMTADLVDAHNETLPALHSALLDWNVDHPTSGGGVAENVSSMFSRRSFLARTGVLAAGGLVLASSGTAASTIAKSKGLGVGERAAKSSSIPTDVEIAALAASLELLAVSTYSAALSAASAGKLGTVPPAVATFVTTARAQHADHGAAWNALVSGAGYKPVAVANPTIAKTVNAAFAKVTNVAGVAALALTLEEVAAATYLEAVGLVSSTKAIATAASIQPVEMQHAAILRFVLGSYPVPSAFSTTSGAATLSDLAGISIAHS